jgi:hypothetical protein
MSFVIESALRKCTVMNYRIAQSKVKVLYHPQMSHFAVVASWSISTTKVTVGFVGGLRRRRDPLSLLFEFQRFPAKASVEARIIHSLDSPKQGLG